MTSLHENICKKMSPSTSSHEQCSEIDIGEKETVKRSVMVRVLSRLREGLWGLLPLRVKVVFGWLESWESITHAVLDREQLWNRVSQPIHALSLEFHRSATLERSYQADVAIRSYQHIPVFSVLLILTPLVTVWLRFLLDHRGLHVTDLSFPIYMLLDPLIVLPFVALLQLGLYLAKNSEWIVKYFGSLQFAFAASAQTAMLVWLYLAPRLFGSLESLVDEGDRSTYFWPLEETTLLATIFTMTVTLLKVSWSQASFLFVLFSSEVFTLRWMAAGTLPLSSRCWFADPASSLVFLGGLFIVLGAVKYGFERLLRKDFVLSHSLIRESDRTERLLANVLPRRIAEQLKAISVEEAVVQDDNLPAEVILAEKHESVSLVLSDVVGFTSLCACTPPAELVDMLNALFSAFDLIAEEEGLEKIKTVGDAYLAAAGLPDPNSAHSAAACRFALRIADYAARNSPLKVRVGVDSGPVVAGVVGARRFAFDLWGGIVDKVQELEGSSRPNEVRISDAVVTELRKSGLVNCFIFQEEGSPNPFLRGETAHGKHQSYLSGIASTGRRFSHSSILSNRSQRAASVACLIGHRPPNWSKRSASTPAALGPEKSDSEGGSSELV